MRKPATERHAEVWKHFSTQLLKVQNLFIHQLNSRDEAYLKWFNDNEKEFARVQPEVYGFAQSIYNELQPQQANYTVPMALLVNSIVDFSSFCTSILTVNDTDIKHVRNLDFDFPAEMQKLLYIQKFIGMDGQVVAEAPSIAGFYGVYTAVKPGYFSMSYNVRYSHKTTILDSGFGVAASSDVWINLENELKDGYKPFQNYFLELILKDLRYEEVVSKLKTQNLNTPSYITLANGQKPEGVIISRGRETVDHLEELSPGMKSWYRLQTNQDCWNEHVHDPRDRKANELISSLDGNTPDIDLVHDVLQVRGVSTSYTIFSVAMNPRKEGSYVKVFKA